MGFLLVFFNEDVKKKPSFFSSSSSSPLPSFNNSLHRHRRSNSANLLISRAQSTMSICAFLIAITFLLFTLSTFEPSTAVSSSHLKTIPPSHVHLSGHYPSSSSSNSHALKGMGTLYRKGTKAMNDIVIAHLIDSVTVNELRLFLRFFHCSGLASRSDLLFIFPSNAAASFHTVIQQENDSFIRLIKLQRTESDSDSESNNTVATEPIWGQRRIRTSFKGGGSESAPFTFGSVVGFDVDELDPENSLSFFLDPLPMDLRRWACYPMLLGRVRRHFKQVMLIDVKDLLLLRDPLTRVRNLTPESVYFFLTRPLLTKHGKKNSKKLIYKGIIMGGGRGIRRLSNTMLTEIVWATMQQHKGKNSVSESGLLNRLVEKEFMLKDVNLIMSIESIPEVSSLVVSNSSFLSNYTVVRLGNSSVFHNNVSVATHSCSLTQYFSVFNNF